MPAIGEEVANRDEVAPATLISLDRHERRRASGGPTVSVLVGPGDSAPRAAREWSARRALSLVELGADAVSNGSDGLASLAAAWAEQLARRCDLADIAGDWLLERRPASPSQAATRVPVRGRSLHELNLLLGDALTAQTAAGAEIACRFLLEREASGRAVDPARLAADLDAAFGDRGKPWIRVLAALAELVPDLIRPALLLVPADPARDGARIDAPARTLAELAIAQPRLTLLLAVAPEPFRAYLDRAPESRIKAMLRESVVEVGETQEEPGRARLLPSHEAGPVGSAGASPSRGTEPVGSPGEDPARDDARSEAERFLFECLEAHRETRGRFVLNGSAGFRFGPTRQAEVDLISAPLKIAIEVDGYHHFLDPEAYRRDRRKDFALQQHGYLVVRVLADDVVSRLEEVLERILSAVRFRRSDVSLEKPKSPR